MLRNLFNRWRKRGPCFEAKANEVGQWYVREVARNGEVQSVFESYSNKSNAVRSAKHKASTTDGGWWRVAPRDLDDA